MSKDISHQTKLAVSPIRRARPGRLFTVIIFIGLLVGLAILSPLHPRARTLSRSVEPPSASQQGITVTTSERQNNRIVSKTRGAPPQMEFVPGEVLLNFKNPEDARLLLKSKSLNATLRLPSTAKLNSVFQRFGVDGASQPFAFTKSERLRYVLKLTAPLLKQDQEKTKELVSALRNDRAIEYVELNLIMRTQTPPNDTYYSSSGAWGQSFRDLWGLQNINAETAWNTANGANVIVAVSDTGVDYNHEDIAANIWTNPGETGIDGVGADKKSNGVDDDHNGFIDDWHGYDFVSSDGNPADNDPMDDHGHGTHVAGTIAAIGNNAKGIIGVAHGAKIMPVKGLNSFGEGTTADLAQTILYAADNGAKVINASWGGFSTAPQQTFIDAIAYAHDTKGVVFVAAAGNGAADVGRQDFGFAPANIRNVVTVSAFDHEDHRAFFSNFGQKIDVAAPGGGDTGPVIFPSDSVLSLLSSQGASFPLELVVDGKYVRSSGTSMAAPHASGVAALILFLHPGFSPEQVRQAMHLGTDDVDAVGFDINSGYGRSNAAKALTVSSPLVAQLVAPVTTIANTCSVNVQGSAAGAGFASWRLEFGEGTNPVTWTQITSSTTPVTNGLLTSWNTSSVGSGLHTIRLIALNTGGQSFEDRLVVNFDDASLTDPAFDFFIESGFRSGLPVTIKGTASGCAFSSYTIKVKRLSDDVTLTSPALTLTNGGFQRVSNDVLAIWDTTNVPADHYELTLQVSQTNGTLSEETTRIIVDPTLHVGWPQNIGLVGSISLSLAITDHLDAADVDLDGDKELIVGYGNTVRLFDHTGNQLPGWPQSIDPQNKGAILQRSPAVGDVDGDGVPEIVAASTVQSTGALTMFIWHADGSSLPGWPRDMDGSFDAVAIADLNGDGAREIVATGWTGLVKVFNKDGQFLPGWPRALRNGILSPPSIGDLNEDGTKEIVVRGVSDNTLHVLTSTGTNVPGWPKAIGSTNNFSYPALGDLNGDHKLEIVVAAGQNVHAFKFDGSEVAGWPQETNLSSINSPAIGDIDGDDRAEVIVGGFLLNPSRSNALYAWHGDGAPLANWPVTISATPFGQSFFGFGSPVLADADGDNRADAIVSGDAGPVPFGIIAYTGSGTPVSSFPKPTIQTGAWNTNTAAVADIDNDGLLELAWLDFMANLFVWDLQSPADAKLPWPMFHHDAQHTGANPLRSGPFDIADQTINEDGSLSFPFGVGDAASITSMTATSSNTTLVPNNPANIAISGSGAIRTLQINPLANAFGTSTIKVTVNGSNSQTMTDTFLLTVNPVNDSPSFTKGPDKTVNENDGAQTVSNWATSISAGPANETGQAVNFAVVSNSNTSLFATAPAIGPTGTLTYIPATGVSGTALVTIALTDNGGTANGGIDTSASQSFNITVREGGALQFSSATFSVAEDGVNASVTVTRSGGAAGEARVNCATNNGTGTAGQDYTGASGTLTFPDGITSQSFNVAITNDVLHEPDETINLTLTSPAGSGSLGAPASAVLTINDNDPQGGTIAFASPSFTVTEIAGSILISVDRRGDMTEAVTVDYATADVTADGRKDYTPARGTLHIDAGKSAGAFPVLVNIDAFAEGSELVELTLTNPTGGAVLGLPATATLQIDNSAWSSPPANSIEHPESFVRQHYHDFLNREPDAGGLAFWSNEITSCGTNIQCREVKRINVSAAFFLSIEFQETGYFVYRIYKTGLGNLPGAPVPVRFTNFLLDSQQIGQGVQVGIGNWQAQLETNKQAFALAFVQSSDFQAAFPNSLTAEQFVDQLNTNAGGSLSANERSTLIGMLMTPSDTTQRAVVLRAVAEDQDLRNAEFNKAFVLMQYFGYLRRNPNDAPDTNFGGWQFWLDKLNQFNGNFVNAEMVKAFLVAGEYRQRFGP